MKILEILTPKRKLGNYGEGAACRFLKRNGYKIKERNYVVEGHEVDVIAESSDTLVFVEVKTRTVGKQNPKEPRPASAVNQKKQRSIISCARIYFAMKRPKKRVRFDVIEVYVNENGRRKSVAEIKHLQNTFNASTAFAPPWRN